MMETQAPPIRAHNRPQSTHYRYPARGRNGKREETKSPTNNSTENVCVVCFRTVDIYSLGECDHPVCFECSTRMRVLCRQNECPICRREMKKVIFTRSICSYASIKDVMYQMDRKYSICFASDSVQRAYYQLLEHKCVLCRQRPQFRTFFTLKEHMRREHDLHYCDLCVEHLMIFTAERRCYTRQDLAHHRRKGDLDDTSHRGHPLCEYCDQRFLDSDELFRHLRKEHYFCHFCDADGLHEFYRSYDHLRDHFKRKHFLCEEGSCKEEQFTSAFRSDIDLRAHRATHHLRSLNRTQAKQARTLELEFSLAPRRQENMSSDSEYSQQHHRRGKGNRNARARSPPEEFPFNPISETSTLPPGNSETWFALGADDFPSLGSGAMPKAKGHGGSNDHGNTATASSNTLAQRLAHQNGRSTWTGQNPMKSGLTDEEFPSLRATVRSGARVTVSSPSAVCVSVSSKDPNVSIQVKPKKNTNSSAWNGKTLVLDKPEPVVVQKPISQPPRPVNSPVYTELTRKKKQSSVLIPVGMNGTVENGETMSDGRKTMMTKRSEIHIDSFGDNDDDIPPLSASVRPPPGFSSSSIYTRPNQTKSAYLQPVDFTKRNQDLVSSLHRLSLSEESFGLVRRLSSQFRSGALGAQEYFNSCINSMGELGFLHVLPELTVLLPDIDKQQALSQVYKHWYDNQGRNNSSEWPFQQCARCGQVVLPRELTSHVRRHRADNEFSSTT